MRHRILLLGLGALVIWAMPVMAFHDDGVAHCDGCHTMHNYVDGVSVAYEADGVTLRPPGEGNDFLLKFASATDLCLSCHEGAGSEGRDVWDFDNDCTLPYEERGGGDFSCSTAVNINDGRGAAIDGEGSGHTLITALGGRATADSVLSVAPGGTYPSTALRCTSCHDPHGTGNFRLLYGAGQVTTGPVVAWGTTMNAIGISLSTRSGFPESDTNHNVYLSGYSEWCATCHGAMHDSGEKVHTTGELAMTPETRGVYNAYIGSAACVGGPCPGPGLDETAGMYLALVPFEDPTRSLTSDDRGPGPNSRVACVTCHRAHGSSAENGGRWEFTVTSLDEDGVNSGTAPLPNPYGPGQRSLCNKCHAKDAYDAVWVP